MDNNEHPAHVPTHARSSSSYAAVVHAVTYGEWIKPTAMPVRSTNQRAPFQNALTST